MSRTITRFLSFLEKEKLGQASENHKPNQESLRNSQSKAGAPKVSWYVGRNMGDLEGDELNFTNQKKNEEQKVR